MRNIDPATDAARGGILIVDSGIQFGSASELQTVPYPGPESINHQQLTNRLAPDAHPQYVAVSGDNMTGPLGMRGYTLLDGTIIAANSISSRGTTRVRACRYLF